MEPHSKPGEKSTLLSGDWRGPSPTPPASSPPSPAAPESVRAPGAGAPKLYRHARPSSFAAERARAADITRQARAAVETAFSDVRFGRKVSIEALSPIIDSIAASIARNPIAFSSVSRLKQLDENSYLHSVAVCGLMISLACELGLPDEALLEIGMAGLLHDIGKARMPAFLLSKPGRLTDEEYAMVKTHVERGVEMLAKSGASSIVLDVCANHHERMDGAGYAHGKTADSLTLPARMAAICDVYDAATSARAYKPALSQSEALERMAADTGQFDPALLGKFHAMVAIFPTGSIVRLQSDRLAVVLDDPGADPVTPPVRTFFCAISRRPLERRRVETTRDPIVGIERPDRWPLVDWPKMRAELLAAA